MSIQKDDSDWEADDMIGHSPQLRWPLASGMLFQDWDQLDNYIKNYAIEVGFSFKQTHGDREMRNGVSVEYRRVYECVHSGVYVPKKKKTVQNDRDRTSQHVDCPFRVNAYLGKKAREIKIGKLVTSHEGHALLPSTITQVAARYTKFGPEMVDDINYFARKGVGAPDIRIFLNRKYPDFPIKSQKLHTAISHARGTASEKIADATELYNKLMARQRDESGWFVEALIQGESNRLAGLFWMRPSQISLYQQYHDVVLNDNTHKSNRYNMYLSVTLVVDNHERSRLVATALLSDETISSYQWILECLKKSSNNVIPCTLYTDGDLAMIAAIQKVIPETKHNLCFFHIVQNMLKRLRPTLGSSWNNFWKDFLMCRNSFTSDAFERKWTMLKEQYPEAARYLNRALDSDKTSWATCYTQCAFTAGIQSTARVECYNRILKEGLTSSSTIILLDEAIQKRLDTEEQYEEVHELVNQLPSIGLPSVASQFFGKVNQMISEHVTPEVAKRIQKQIKSCVIYRINVVSKEEAKASEVGIKC
jgi:hypothetical protein